MTKNFNFFAGGRLQEAGETAGQVAWQGIGMVTVILVHGAPRIVLIVVFGLLYMYMLEKSKKRIKDVFKTYFGTEF